MLHQFHHTTVILRVFVAWELLNWEDFFKNTYKLKPQKEIEPTQPHSISIMLLFHSITRTHVTSSIKKVRKNSFSSTQVEDSGHQIPKEPAGKRLKKRWILHEYTGSHRNMEAVFQPENFRIFSGDFRAVPDGKHRKMIGMRRKKSGNFPAWILLSCSDDLWCIPAGTVPYSLTWVYLFFSFIYL